MRVIRLGARGDHVEAWQTFLRGQDAAEREVDGVYDAAWLALTAAFQGAHGIVADGVVGPRTYARAQALGFNPGFVDDSEDELGPHWPPAPTFAPYSAEERAALLGSFEFRPAPSEQNAEGIEILGDWVQQNIETVQVPQLLALTRSGKVRLHRRAVVPFSAFFAAVERAGLLDQLLGFGGSFAPRYVRGSRTRLSNHAYGTAMDLNVPYNRLGTTPALKGKRGSLRELVALANEHGLYWGGHFRRPDGMHFELAKR
jgi:hypothetical protein